MRHFQFIIILIFLMTGCHKTKAPKVIDDLSVSAEVIGRASCCLDGDGYDNAIVQILVKNDSKVPKSFWIMRCSWGESFRTDRDDLYLCERECTSNYPFKINLETNQSITFNGIIKQKKGNNRVQPYSFKIGLIMLDPNDFHDRDKKYNNIYKATKKTYWSNLLYLDYNTLGYKLIK